MARTKRIEPLGKGYTIYTGSFQDVILFRGSDGGWGFDGPAGFGPKEVRRGPRGPSWQGTVEEKFVRDILRRARKHGLRIREW